MNWKAELLITASRLMNLWARCMTYMTLSCPWMVGLPCRWSPTGWWISDQQQCRCWQQRSQHYQQHMPSFMAYKSQSKHHCVSYQILHLSKSNCTDWVTQETEQILLQIWQITSLHLGILLVYNSYTTHCWQTNSNISFTVLNPRILYKGLCADSAHDSDALNHLNLSLDNLHKHYLLHYANKVLWPKRINRSRPSIGSSPKKPDFVNFTVHYKKNIFNNRRTQGVLHFHRRISRAATLWCGGQGDVLSFQSSCSWLAIFYLSWVRYNLIQF